MPRGSFGHPSPLSLTIHVDTLATILAHTTPEHQRLVSFLFFNIINIDIDYLLTKNVVMYNLNIS